MSRAIVVAILCLTVVGCSGVVTRTSFFDQSSSIPPFLAEIGASQFEKAYELLCPPIRSATDYRAFVSAMKAHPYLNRNAGFSTRRSYGLLGSGVTTYTGWLASADGTVPAEITVDAHATPCVLGMTIIGDSILPPFGIAGLTER